MNQQGQVGRENGRSSMPVALRVPGQLNHSETLVRASGDGPKVVHSWGPAGGQLNHSETLVRDAVRVGQATLAAVAIMVAGGGLVPAQAAPQAERDTHGQPVVVQPGQGGGDVVMGTVMKPRNHSETLVRAPAGDGPKVVHEIYFKNHSETLVRG